MVSSGNLSLQYVNSMNCIVRLLLGATGGRDMYGRPLTQSRSGLNLALQWHLCCPQVQGSNHEGMVFFGGSLLKVHAFTSM